MRILPYLFSYFFYRIKEFFRHWYVGGSYVFFHQYLSMLESFDQVLAWKVTLKNIFQPLYKDFSFIGYILGFIFRSGRLIVGGFIYICIFVLGAVIYLIWLLLPVVAVLGIFGFKF